MADTEIVILDSAYKHGVTEESIRACLFKILGDELLGYPPPKRLIAGFDHRGSPLEIIVVEDERRGRTVVIHAMALRKKYYYLLEDSQ